MLANKCTTLFSSGDSSGLTFVECIFCTAAWLIQKKLGVYNQAAFKKLVTDEAICLTVKSRGRPIT